MKKILFMIHDLGQGGAEKVLVNLVNNINRKEFDVTVLSLFGGGVNEQFLNKNIRYETVFSRQFPGNSHFLKLCSPKQLHRLFIKEKYDVEVAYLEGTSARIISGCPHKGTKLVSWIHVEQYTKKCVAKAFRSYRESKVCYEKFHKVICVSENVKNCFMRLYPTIEDTMVIYNTNDITHILKSKEEEVSESVFTENEIRLVAMGKVMPSKGYDKLARIHNKLRKDGYNVHTYVLGDGPDIKKIRMYLIENNLEESFTFLGYQTNPYKYLAKCDIFVCTSVAEGFSTAVTEALILGLPVVTTSVAGMKELLGDNDEYGIVVDKNEEAVYEGIKRLVEDEELFEQFRKKSLIRSEFFKRKNTVKAVEEVLTEI